MERAMTSPLTIQLHDGARAILEAHAARAGRSLAEHAALVLALAATREAMAEARVRHAEAQKVDMLNAVDGQLRELGVLK
jgi:hypothetical protein